MNTFIVIKPFNHRGADVATGDKVALNPLQATQLLELGLVEAEPKAEAKAAPVADIKTPKK